MATLDELFAPFAAAIYAKASAVNRLNLTATQRRAFSKASPTNIKKVGNFVRHKVSRAACDAATPLGVDLREKNWHDQHGFDPKRATFHVEHMMPVSAIRAACLKASSDAEVAAILKERLCIVWILKTEDRELTKRGFRDVRDDPIAAYRACGIDVVDDDA